jgi:hypothetical protein
MSLQDYKDVAFFRTCCLLVYFVLATVTERSLCVL